MTGGRGRRLAAALGILLVCGAPSLRPQERAAAGFLLRGGTVADGGRGPLRAADVRVRGARILEVGPGLAAGSGERVIDVAGLVVAPGFIDLHSHVDRQVFALDARSQVAQGITTAVVGVDGGGPYPVGRFLDRVRAAPPALNVAAMAGHGAIRRAVMGEAGRHARPPERAAMAEALRRALAEGAFGVSSGLAYEPGASASAAEIAALAEEAARAGGFYATHVRDEGDAALDALAEATDVARASGAAVHVSHLKLASAVTRGRAAAALALLDGAPRVTADWYPYPFWVSTTAALAPPRRASTRGHWARVLADAGGADRLTVTSFAADRSYVGRTVAQIAAARGAAPEAVMLDLERRGHAGIAAEVMDEGDLEAFLRSPRVMIASDGGIEVAHPRGAGTFPRVLGRYVRDRRVIPLETAIHKMTGMPARLLGLADRGRVEPGAYADLVVFDPATVADRATILEPQLPPTGIVHVFVNGVAVIADGGRTAARPGRPLLSRRPGSGDRSSESATGDAPLLPGDVGHGQPLDGLPVAEVRLADLGQVALGDAGVPGVVGVHGQRDPPAAVLQAAGLAHDHALAQAALLHHGLQPLVERDGALGRAGALGVVRRPLVGAHQDVTLGLGHAHSPREASIVGWMSSGGTFR